MLKALIFDFDGTLLDTETSEFRRWEALYRQHDRELALADWQQGIGTWGAFDPWAGLPEAVHRDRERVHAELQAAVLADIRELDLRPGVRALLAEARDAGLRLAIASSSGRDWIEPWLEQHALSGVFEVRATREDVARVKPDPALYQLALERLDLRPEEALAIEDSLNGAAAAAAAGLRVLVVPNDVTASQPFWPEWPRLAGFEGGLGRLLAAVGEL